MCAAHFNPPTGFKMLLLRRWSYASLLSAMSSGMLKCDATLYVAHAA
jgi:hypothetical protein